MSAAQLFIAFFILCVAGAVLALLTPQRWLPALLAIIGSLAALVLLVVSTMLLVFGAAVHFALWPVLTLGTLTLEADPLSAFFLFVTGLIFLPVSIFSASYLGKYLEHHDLRYFSILYHALFASIVLILIAGDVISFLVAWEFMSIASYLLVNYDFERAESSHAGYVMLAMSEGGTIAVAIAFILIAGTTGELGFSELRSSASMASDTLRWAIFLLSFFGFAVKAGLVPLNSWLPLAHPVAPTNVSALLSAVIVNLGIYGIVRTNLDLAPLAGAAPGLIVLVIGSLSALIGILYATIQGEMKRLLAHSTIENMGIVAASVGAAMVFTATEHRIVAAIALVAALYHLANHSVYKALLFIGTATSYMLVALAILLALTFIGFRLLTRYRGIARGAAWAGGLRHLTPALTYTATGFSNPVRVIFAALLTPAASEESTEAVATHFRTAIKREYTEIHIIDRFVLQPPIHALRNIAAFARRMHVGHVNAYAAYVLLAILFVLIVGVALI